ncbi:hypothetical protein, partial [Dickeya dianthicola]|uniref:hypothetical protein n=1 Tax=Dickeya dianthicola TaxID=204039 RepID=UPI001C7200AE
MERLFFVLCCHRQHGILFNHLDYPEPFTYAASYPATTSLVVFCTCCAPQQGYLLTTTTLSKMLPE